MSSNSTRTLLLAAACGSALLAPSAVFSSGPAPEAMLVREMLDIDARLALHKERENLEAAMGKEARRPAQTLPTGTAPSIAPVSTGSRYTPAPVEAVAEHEQPVATPQPEQAPALSVLGIFGLGNQLFVDIEIDQRRVRFQRGSPKALGAHSDIPYRLAAIKPPCVTLISLKQGDQSQTVCLEEFN
ncbi:hypothetical protein ACYCFK_09415 [Stutzerimonas stutzeri]